MYFVTLGLAFLMAGVKMSDVRWVAMVLGSSIWETISTPEGAPGAGGWKNKTDIQIFCLGFRKYTSICVYAYSDIFSELVAISTCIKQNINFSEKTIYFNFDSNVIIIDFCNTVPILWALKR